MKKFLLVFFSLIFILGCSQPIYRDSDFLFNTTCFVSSNNKKAVKEIFSALRELDSNLNAVEQNSKLNNLLKENPQTVLLEGDLAKIFLESAKFNKLLSGAFDPTIFTLSSLWQIGRGATLPPTPDEIKNAKNLCGIEKSSFIEQRDFSSVTWSRPIGMALDFGACAKGFAGEEVLKKINFDKNFVLMNLGGNVFAFGKNPAKRKWRVGIQNPFLQRGVSCLMLELENSTVSTSGIYERFFEYNGQRFHHILDLQSGAPAKSGLASVTVVSPFGFVADACSTGFFVLGIDKSLQLIKEERFKEFGVEVIFITEEGEIFATSGLKENLTLIKNETASEGILRGEINFIE